MEGDLESQILKIFNVFGHNITDGTIIKCDLCYRDGSEFKGGVIIKEKEGSVSFQFGDMTFSCNNCFNIITCASDEERKKLKDLNKYQIQAIKQKIGTDPEEYGYFNPDRTFKENVIRYKQENPNHSSWKCIAKLEDESNSNRNKNKEQDKGRFSRMCKNCQQVFEAKDLKRCSQCRMAYYCSQDCQKKDWKLGHKKDCIKIIVK